MELILLDALNFASAMLALSAVVCLFFTVALGLVFTGITDQRHDPRILGVLIIALVACVGFASAVGSLRATADYVANHPEISSD